MAEAGVNGSREEKSCRRRAKRTGGKDWRMGSGKFSMSLRSLSQADPCAWDSSVGLYRSKRSRMLLKLVHAVPPQFCLR